MKRVPAVLALTAAAVLLSACSSEITQETITVTPGQTGTFSAGDTTVVVEPEASSASPADAQYLTDVRGKLGGLASASDEQLVELGQSACAQLDEGAGPESVLLAVPAGLTPSAGDSVAIAKAADATLCN